MLHPLPTSPTMSLAASSMLRNKALTAGTRTGADDGAGARARARPGAGGLYERS